MFKTVGCRSDGSRTFNTIDIGRRIRSLGNGRLVVICFGEGNICNLLSSTATGTDLPFDQCNEAEPFIQEWKD